MSLRAGELMTLQETAAEAKQRFGFGGSTRVASCFQAGRDGFYFPPIIAKSADRQSNS